MFYNNSEGGLIMKWLWLCCVLGLFTVPMTSGYGGFYQTNHEPTEFVTGHAELGWGAHAEPVIPPPPKK